MEPKPHGVQELRALAAQWRLRAGATQDPYFIAMMLRAADDLEAFARAEEERGGPQGAAAPED